jgi:hypothetical protein
MTATCASALLMSAVLTNRSGAAVRRVQLVDEETQSDRLVRQVTPARQGASSPEQRPPGSVASTASRSTPSDGPSGMTPKDARIRTPSQRAVFLKTTGGSPYGANVLQTFCARSAVGNSVAHPHRGLSIAFAFAHCHGAS